jgi:hypothetical protein
MVPNAPPTNAEKPHKLAILLCSFFPFQCSACETRLAIQNFLTHKKLCQSDASSLAV